MTNPTPSTIFTDDIDLIAFAVVITGSVPPMHWDGLAGKVAATIPAEIITAYHADTNLQRYLRAKRAVWKAVDATRRGGRR